MGGEKISAFAFAREYFHSHKIFTSEVFQAYDEKEKKKKERETEILFQCFYVHSQTFVFTRKLFPGERKRSGDGTNMRWV